MTPPSVKLGSIVAGLLLVVGIAMSPLAVVLARLGAQSPGPRFSLATVTMPTLTEPVWIVGGAFTLTAALAIAFMSVALTRHTARA